MRGAKVIPANQQAGQDAMFALLWVLCDLICLGLVAKKHLYMGKSVYRPVEKSYQPAGP